MVLTPLPLHSICVFIYLLGCFFLFLFFFFFQAEDGIRDRTVTGVQTCALPIWRGPRVFGDILEAIRNYAGADHQADRSAPFATRPDRLAVAISRGHPDQRSCAP